jgi:hypothetical protein
LPGFRFHGLRGRNKLASPSTPAETGGPHSVGWTGIRSTSIWKTIPEDKLDDQEAPRSAACRLCIPVNFYARRFCQPLIGPRTEIAKLLGCRVRRAMTSLRKSSRRRQSWHCGSAVRQRFRPLAQSAEAVRSATRRAGTRREDQGHSYTRSGVRVAACCGRGMCLDELSDPALDSDGPCPGAAWGIATRKCPVL